MKKMTLAFLLIVSLGLLSWGSAQGSRNSLFDAKKSQQELQVMKGILNTTLGFIAGELRTREQAGQGQKPAATGAGGIGGGATGPYVAGVYGGSGGSWGTAWGGTSITAFYLYGQGATFIVPISSLRTAFGRTGRLTADLESLKLMQFDQQAGIEAAMAAADKQLQAAAVELEDQKASIRAAARAEAEQAVQAARAQGGGSGGVSGGVGHGTGQTVAPAPAKPQAASAPENAARDKQRSEDLKKRLAESQERVRKSREEMEAQRQKLIQSISEIKGYLIDALANYGDSLTHVKPNEYINIILTTDEGFPIFSDEGASRSQREVISIQKSAISDHKAGKLSLEALRQKVLQYSS